MKTGDFYRHYKGGEYFFDCIALPLETSDKGKNNLQPCFTQTARYHENTHDLNLYFLNGVTFIDSDIPHVIYQAEKDYDTDFVWAREVNDFFDTVFTKDGGLVKRFYLKS